MREIATYANAGFTELIVLLLGQDPLRQAEDVAAALPRIREVA